MYHVYILKSLINSNKTYVGLTIKEPKERLVKHSDGLSRYTNTFKPWELIYFENFYCRTCAEKREMFLKSGLGHRLRKIILDNYKALKV